MWPKIWLIGGKFVAAEKHWTSTESLRGTRLDGRAADREDRASFTAPCGGPREMSTAVD